MKTDYTISFAALSWYFPEDTIWRASGAEICGYSPEKKLYIIIDDGTCTSPTGDGRWLCHVWKIKDGVNLPVPYGKYPDETYWSKIREEWLSFIPKKTAEDTDTKGISPTDSFTYVQAVCQYRCGKVGDTFHCAKGANFGNVCEERTCPIIKATKK